MTMGPVMVMFMGPDSMPASNSVMHVTIMPADVRIGSPRASGLRLRSRGTRSWVMPRHRVRLGWACGVVTRDPEHQGEAQ